MQGELGQILSVGTGTVEKWLKEEGEGVKKGESVVLIRDIDDPGKIHRVISGIDGEVAEILAYPNTVVVKGQTLAIVTSPGDPRRDLELVGFVSSLEGKKIQSGMDALVDPTIINPYNHGHLLASVKRVGKLPMSKVAIQSLVKIPEVAKYIKSRIDAEPFVVILSLERDEEHLTGYRWSGPGPSFLLDSGIFADIRIVYARPTILSLLWPSLLNFWPQGS